MIIVRRFVVAFFRVFCFVGFIFFIIFLYENIFSLFPIVGVVLHTSAFWITEEKIIRRVSFMGSPFWLVYNMANTAYGSVVGNVLVIISIVIAMLRLDYKKDRK